jgi:hypothetical protein
MDRLTGPAATSVNLIAPSRERDTASVVSICAQNPVREKGHQA